MMNDAQGFARRALHPQAGRHRILGHQPVLGCVPAGLFAKLEKTFVTDKLVSLNLPSVKCAHYTVGRSCAS